MARLVKRGDGLWDREMRARLRACRAGGGREWVREGRRRGLLGMFEDSGGKC